MHTKEEIGLLIEEAMQQAQSNFRDKKFEAVVVLIEQVLKIDPENHDARQLLGTAYHALRRHDDAKRHFDLCLMKEPQNPETINNLALCSSARGDYLGSIDLLKRAADLSPDSATIHANLGLQYRHIGEFHSAISHYLKSLELREIPTTYAMIGGCYGEMKELELAEKYIRKAIDSDPDFHAAHIDLASVLHLRGEYPEAFRSYERRFQVFEQLQIWSKIYDPAKRWRGEEPSGKTILVHMEQGNGDTIHFSRYLPLLKEMGARVVLHCSDVLADICRDKADELFTLDPKSMPGYRESSDLVPPHDAHCSLVSLPHVLNNPEIPKCPYIVVDGEYDMTSYAGLFKVGMVWAGNPQHPNDKFRSCKLEFFKPIHDLPGVKLFSLMKDCRARTYDGKEKIDLSAGADDMKVVDMSAHMNTYLDTAKIIKGLDLVVGVDTSVIHLAGAMGKPAICLLAWNPDWRWGLEGDSSAWYPSVKFIRQDRRGCWDDVFVRLVREIKGARGEPHASR